MPGLEDDRARAADEPDIAVEEPADDGPEIAVEERADDDEPEIAVREAATDEPEIAVREAAGDAPDIAVDEPSDEPADDEPADDEPADDEDDDDNEQPLELSRPVSKAHPRGPRTKASPNEKGARRDMILTLVIVGVALAYMVGGPVVRRLSAHPSEKECAELLDKYVEHVAYAVDPSPTSSAAADRKALARASAKGRAAFTRCETELTRSELDCAMHAPSADTFERCLP